MNAQGLKGFLVHYSINEILRDSEVNNDAEMTKYHAINIKDVLGSQIEPKDFMEKLDFLKK